MIEIWGLITIDLYLNLINDKELIKMNDNQKIKQYLYNKISIVQKEAKYDNSKKEILDKITVLVNCSIVCEVFWWCSFSNRIKHLK